MKTFVSYGIRLGKARRIASPKYAAFAAIAFLALSLPACATFAVKTPDLAAIPDGSYRGSAEDFPVAATVEVSMSGGRIERVVILEHQTMLGKSAEAIADRVVEKQSLEVDCVTGATMSSRVILKAIERALAPSAR